MHETRRLLSFVKPYWKRAVAALVLLTTLVFLDLSIPRLIQRLIDQGVEQQNQQVVIQTSIVMLAISAVSTVIAIGNNNLSVQVGESTARDVREALFLKIQTLSFANLDQMQTGQLLVRLSSDTSAFQRLVQVSLRIGTRAPLLMIGSLILMFVTAPALALAILPLLIVTSLLIVFFIFKTEPLFRSVRQKLDRLNNILQENVAGVRLVKSFVRADFEADRFETANEDFHGAIGARDGVHGDDVARADDVRQHRHGHRHLRRRPAGDCGQPAGGADRGVHKLSIDDHDAVDHDDDAVQHVGRRHCRGEAH